MSELKLTEEQRRLIEAYTANVFRLIRRIYRDTSLPIERRHIVVISLADVFENLTPTTEYMGDSWSPGLFRKMLIEFLDRYQQYQSVFWSDLLGRFDEIFPEAKNG